MTEKQFAVILSGRPAGEIEHRFVGFGSAEACWQMMGEIDAALFAGEWNIPHCGTRVDGQEWLWRTVRGFDTLDEARDFALHHDENAQELPAQPAAANADGAVTGDPRKVSLSEAAKLSRAIYHRLLAEEEAAREAEAARNADPRDAELTRLRERAAEWSEIEDLLMERGELTPGVSLSKQVAGLLSKLETKRDVLEAECDDLQAERDELARQLAAANEALDVYVQAARLEQEAPEEDEVDRVLKHYKAWMRELKTMNPHDDVVIEETLRFMLWWDELGYSVCMKEGENLLSGIPNPLAREMASRGLTWFVDGNNDWIQVTDAGRSWLKSREQSQSAAESDELQAAVTAAVAGVDNLSPLEALTRLLELRRRVIWRRDDD